MNRLRVFMSGVLFAISLMLGFALVFSGCATSTGESKSSGSASASTEQRMIAAEAVPEGILLTFLDIPEGTDRLSISFKDWGDDGEPDWGNLDAVSHFNSMQGMLEIQSAVITGNKLEQLKETGSIMLPFVQPGRTYTITVSFSHNSDLIIAANTECTAEAGTFFNRGEITLNLNSAKNSVTLSALPVFPKKVQYGQLAMMYSIQAMVDDAGQIISFNSELTEALRWNFGSGFVARLKKDGVANGDYPAFVTATNNIIYNDTIWMVDIAKTPVFTYSF